ncbi:immunoglobulin domain-containing protein [Ditylenchus destructor]|uniref:Immunoglobulin domain-containing protein n=1 Tax=Ditylenchus destructor TaxID=166010 RepID=A0AAD4NJA5_9BILA|nr:immunoglobulin domain-containing protein [Ditylenchus destructor]
MVMMILTIFLSFLSVAHPTPLLSNAAQNEPQISSPGGLIVEEESTSIWPGPAVNEMLVPINSTTALICEPIFNAKGGEHSRATWIKNGQNIAKVTGHSNSVLRDGRISRETQSKPSQQQGNIPEVGFLILTHITIEDEGDYWCSRDDTGQQGEKTRLRVAYLHNANRGRTSSTTQGLAGHDIRLDCPDIEAVPPPAVSWFLNGDPVDFSGSQRVEVTQNGSLLIQDYTPTQDSGLYECVLANFAGKTSASIFLPGAESSQKIPERQERPSSTTTYANVCAAYLRNGILWFLIGCVSTSVIVLVYLLAGLICYRYSQSRPRVHLRPVTSPTPLLPNQTDRNYETSGPSSLCCWLMRVAVDPRVPAPGFRKPIVPVVGTTRSVSDVSSELMEIGHEA